MAKLQSNNGASSRQSATSSVSWVIFLLGCAFLATSWMHVISLRPVISDHPGGGAGMRGGRVIVVHSPCPQAAATNPTVVPAAMPPVRPDGWVSLADGSSPEAHLDEEKAKTLLDGSFDGEAFRLERKSFVPPFQPWSFCAPLPPYASKEQTGSPSAKTEALNKMSLAAAEAGKSIDTPLNNTELSALPRVNPLCPTSDFWVVHQKTDGAIDNVVAFLEQSEKHMTDLFSAILSTELHQTYAHLGGTCALRPKDSKHEHGADGCMVTAGHFAPQDRKKLVFMDIGSNHGYFTLFALGAAPFLTAFAFEPQVECSNYIRSALQMSGFSHRSHVFNALAGDEKSAVSEAGAQGSLQTLHFGAFSYFVPPASIASIDVPLRTGCRGTFPSISESEIANVKKHFAHLSFDPTATTKKVGFVDPSKVLADQETTILLAKIDVEGFESEVLDALEPLMKAGRIANIAIEINKTQKLRRAKRGKTEQELAGWEVLHDPFVVEWVRGLLKRLQGHGFVLVPNWTGFRNHIALDNGPDEAGIKWIAESGVNSFDLFAYLPHTKVAGLKSK